MFPSDDTYPSAHPLCALLLLAVHFPVRRPDLLALAGHRVSTCDEPRAAYESTRTE